MNKPAGYASLESTFPLGHLLLFLRPDHLGNNRYHNWNSDRALGVLNNCVEANVYLGLITLPLVPLAIANRRACSRGFWFVVADVVVFDIVCEQHLHQ